MSNSCTDAFSITVSSTACVPDSGPPVPATWSDPQPSSLTITGYNPAAFQVPPVCGAGTAVLNFDGNLPVRATISPATLVYATAGSSFFSSQPFFVGANSALIFIQFFSNGHWGLTIRCESSTQVIWAGQKLVGTTPVGTYMFVPNAGSATLPACLHVAEKNVDWTPMVWVPTLVQPSGTASASGAGGTFSVSASAATPVTNFGQILGTMNYTGPQIGVRMRITVTSPDTGGFSSVRVRVNGSTLTVTPAVGFSVGVTDHYFTIFDPANPSNPLVGATVEIRAIAQTNIPGNSPAYSGVLT